MIYYDHDDYDDDDDEETFCLWEEVHRLQWKQSSLDL